eukprot:177528-Rhodomonas_salina.1
MKNNLSITLKIEGSGVSVELLSGLGSLQKTHNNFAWHAVAWLVDDLPWEDCNRSHDLETSFSAKILHWEKVKC